MAQGRPTKFNDKVTATICQRIAEGESLRRICSDPDMPAMSSVFKWLTEQPTFSEQYTRAREVQADTLFDDVLQISDTATPEDIAVARLKVDARKWMAGKLRPKKYGDKLDAEVKHSGQVIVATGVPRGDD